MGDLVSSTKVQRFCLTRCEVYDEACAELRKSFETNTTLITIILDYNNISDMGVCALLQRLANNKSVVEVQVRHQTKVMTSFEEGKLVAALGDNHTLTTLGLDLRNPQFIMRMKNKMCNNREYQRKLRQSNTNLENVFPATPILTWIVGNLHATIIRCPRKI